MEGYDMTIFESIILTIFDVTCYVLVSQSLLEKKARKSYLLVCILFFSVVGGIESNLVDGWYNTLILGVLLIIMTYILYKQKLLENIYVYLISSIFILSIQLLSVLPLLLIFGDISYNFKNGLIAQSIFLASIFLVTKFIPIHYIYDFVINKNKVFKYLIINTFIILLFVLVYWNISINGFLENLISISTLSLVIIYINFIILKNSLKNEQALNKLKVNEQYMPVIDELISDIKARQHDFKNHLQALNMMIFAAKDKEDLLIRYEKYTGEIASKDELNEFLKYNNRVVSGFLYGKKSQAEAMNIKFSVQILEPVFESKLYDYEWIELFGIFIDNAIETNVENNEIIVIIDKEKDMNVLIVKNKHPYLEKEILKNMFNRGVSSKSKSNRGYGLNNVKQIVTKYHGSIEAYNESGADNFVVLKALIP
ncbi:MAG: hypothetical protein CVU84_11870 [Firmicutes bacterium HGW-Firmicutes-1]|jgi:signal transduction histidine kinase|nr:MAG: hypothetical protein CVU84_11870 [Firmicutes bacterium HGW-Firmicutes-1]